MVILPPGRRLAHAVQPLAYLPYRLNSPTVRPRPPYPRRDVHEHELHFDLSSVSSGSARPVQRTRRHRGVQIISRTIMPRIEVASQESTSRELVLSCFMRLLVHYSYIWLSCSNIVVTWSFWIVPLPPPRCLDCVHGPTCAHLHTSGFSLAIPPQETAFLGVSVKEIAIRVTQIQSDGLAKGDATQKLSALVACVAVISCVDLPGAVSAPRTNSFVSETRPSRPKVSCGTNRSKQARARVPYAPLTHFPRLPGPRQNKRQR